MKEVKEVTAVTPTFLVCLIGWVVVTFIELLIVGREPACWGEEFGSSCTGFTTSVEHPNCRC